MTGREGRKGGEEGEDEMWFMLRARKPGEFLYYLCTEYEFLF